MLHAASGARAETVTLVGNIGQGDGGTTGRSDIAQAFTTGSADAGYTLTGVDIELSSAVEGALASVAVGTRDGGQVGARIEVIPFARRPFACRIGGSRTRKTRTP